MSWVAAAVLGGALAAAAVVVLLRLPRAEAPQVPASITRAERRWMVLIGAVALTLLVGLVAGLGASPAPEVLALVLVVGALMLALALGWAVLNRRQTQ